MSLALPLLTEHLLVACLTLMAQVNPVESPCNTMHALPLRQSMKSLPTTNFRVNSHLPLAFSSTLSYRLSGLSLVGESLRDILAFVLMHSDAVCNVESSKFRDNGDFEYLRLY